MHGTAFGAPEFATMGSLGMGLVWSPASNVFLYGGGTDLSKTTDVPLALASGVTVALAPDWSLGGSRNLLDELRFAAAVDASQFGGALGPERLVQMVTVNPARILGLADQLGSLQVGLLADVVVLGGDRQAPYLAVLAAQPRDVRLVVVQGRVLYGDDQLAALGPAEPACEALDVCGRAKFLCLAVPPVAAGDPEQFTQTFAEVEAVLSTELAAYDALGLSAWTFAPLTPLVACP